MYKHADKRHARLERFLFTEPFFFYEHKLLERYINMTANINTDSINGSAAIGNDKAEQTDYYCL